MPKKEPQPDSNDRAQQIRGALEKALSDAKHTHPDERAAIYQRIHEYKRQYHIVTGKYYRVCHEY